MSRWNLHTRGVSSLEGHILILAGFVSWADEYIPNLCSCLHRTLYTKMIHFLNFRKKLYIGSIWQTPDKNPRTFTSAQNIYRWKVVLSNPGLCEPVTNSSLSQQWFAPPKKWLWSRPLLPHNADCSIIVVRSLLPFETAAKYTLPSMLVLAGRWIHSNYRYQRYKPHSCWLAPA